MKSLIPEAPMPFTSYSTGYEAADVLWLEAVEPLVLAAERLSTQMNNLLLIAEIPKRFAQSFNEAQEQMREALAPFTEDDDNEEPRPQTQVILPLITDDRKMLNGGPRETPEEPNDA